MKPPLYVRDIAEALWDGGWANGDWFRDITDRPIRGLVYVVRVYEGQYQCLSLLTGPWEGASFLEAILLVYQNPFNSKAKQRQIPLCARTIRGGLDELLAAVNHVYPVPPPEPRAKAAGLLSSHPSP